jgi:hypothetical protein
MRVAAPEWSHAPAMLQARDVALTIGYADLWRAHRGHPLRIRLRQAAELDAVFERLQDAARRGCSAVSRGPTPARCSSCRCSTACRPTRAACATAMIPRTCSSTRACSPPARVCSGVAGPLGRTAAAV